MAMKTVHLILNAHLDPIWLWPWQAGLDAAIATCRSACDRLDTHGDIYFNRGEAWVYEQIERVDPDLFSRIRQHVETGRWNIVGGWYIQPDCNMPSGFALQKQIELGKCYFTDRFGVFPRIAYNVDSFGHAASLPALMRQAGQDSYIMMRPREHELMLPARLFRWQGHDDGPQVVTFRIAHTYNTRQLTVEHICNALSGLPDGIEHTMCFVGVGDHGGGPTEDQIAWCRQHANAVEGAQLVFSTPQAFFSAIENDIDQLPLVVGELQMHAIGCYSVHRPVKTGLRKAEHLLRQAEIIRVDDLDPAPDSDNQLDQAWRWTAFHHFHDTLGGTCLPSAFEQVDAQLGFARAVADQQIHLALRRKITMLGDDTRQRMVFFNASDQPFDGYTEFEPFLDWAAWQPHWRLVDGDGCSVHCQLIDPEASVNDMTRLLFHVHVEPRQLCVIYINRQAGDMEKLQSRVTGSADRLSNDCGLVLTTSGDGTLAVSDQYPLSLPHLELIDDTTDTWSHNVDRYPQFPVEHVKWHDTHMVDSGPLMASVVRRGVIGRSSVQAEWRLYAGELFAELHLRVTWVERQKLLKLTWPLPGELVNRLDGIPGEQLQRGPDGYERPLRDRTRLELADATTLAVVCPDVFALDANPSKVRFTLLRSSVMAHHAPNPATNARRIWSDHGEHTFRFRFFTHPAPLPDVLDRHALVWHRPLITADLTRGMLAYPSD